MTAPSREEIETELERVVASPGLARSPQLAKFLRYIVEAKLAGNEAGIKAYAVAVDVFGRPSTFDPQADPIVRVQARRLRAALDAYYLDSDNTRRVRIYLPVGGYIPEFEAVGDNPVVETARRSLLREARGRSPVAAWLSEAGVILALVVVVLGLAVVATNVLRQPRPNVVVLRPPHLIVADFMPVQPGQSASQVAGLAIELVTDLELFETIDVDYGGARPATNVDDDAYSLGGIVRTDGGQVRVTASLRLGDGDTALWNDTVTIPESEISHSVDDISQTFAQDLGSRRGPLHSNAVKLLAGFDSLAGRESDYVCELLFGQARDSQARPELVRANECIDGLLSRQPDSARAQAMSAALATEQLFNRLVPGPEDTVAWGGDRRSVCGGARVGTDQQLRVGVVCALSGSAGPDRCGGECVLVGVATESGQSRCQGGLCPDAGSGGTVGSGVATGAAGAGGRGRSAALVSRGARGAGAARQG